MSRENDMAVRETKGELTGRIGEVAQMYKRRLDVNPADAEALAAIALVALASGQAESAAQMAGLAVMVAPKMTAAWIVLGQALKSRHIYKEAERAYRQALLLEEKQVLARIGLGELLLEIGNTAAAVEEFSAAIASDGGLVAAHLGLGNSFAVQQQYDRALECYGRAMQLQPDLPEVEFAAGFVLARIGKEKEAEARYRRALVLREDFAAAWINLGSLYREQGKEMPAEAALQRAAALRPDLVSAWVNLAVLEKERCDWQQAEAYLQKAYALQPGQVETLIAWCQLCVAKKDLPGAWQWLQKAEVVQANHSEVENMRGILLHTEGRFAEAVLAFADAEQLGSASATSNRGNSLLDLGRVQEAHDAHRAAVEKEPGNAGATYNLALSELRLGQWQSGWQHYEARWRFREVHRHQHYFRQPRWKGEPLDGQRVLLYAEQGLGDTIQFCRYAECVADRGGVPVLQVQKPVERLLRSLAVVREGRAEIVPSGNALPDFDLESPLMSLPAAFGTTVKCIPWKGAYLGAGLDLVKEKRRLASVGNSEEKHLRVGIAWAGNPRYKADGVRSMRLEMYLPLLRVAGVAWISLQKGDAAEQLQVLPQSVSVLDGCRDEDGMHETAALIAALDLVITTDTSIAHLAGAMAKPVWILLPHLADWRWMQRTEATPWYPTARLFRQRRAGDWSGVVSRVSELCGSLVASAEAGTNAFHNAEVIGKVMNGI